MNLIDIMKTRKSVRTFDGRAVTPEDKAKLAAYMETITNPYGIPVEFVWLDPREHGLHSTVIEGEDLYIAGKVPAVPNCEAAFGFSFEKLVLYAWSLGIGTTWIGGTMNRDAFEAAAKTGENEYMMIVTPIGYPAAEKSEVDRNLRERVDGDHRAPAEELFFDQDFSKPLKEGIAQDWIEAVRWAPSAVNLQPWRIVKDGSSYHFYVQHSRGYRPNKVWDVQKIDVGIAICHFMLISGGAFALADPGIALEDEYFEYVATVTV